jgi:hypothetical protein
VNKEINNAILRVQGWAKRAFWPRESYLRVSNGTTSRRLPIVLDDNGLIDQSMLSGTALAEYIADTVGAMVTGNSETGIAVTYQDGDNTLDFVVDAEFIADTVGAMVTGNTETNITVTYQDADNTLDFELGAAVVIESEGTWTPTVFDAASGGNQGTASTAIGFYIKHGKQVEISCVLVNIDTTGMTAGNTLHIRGLPFTSKSTASYRATAFPQINMVTFSGYVEALLINNTAYVRLFENTSGANAAALIVSDYTSGSAAIAFSMTYWTD